MADSNQDDLAAFLNQQAKHEEMLAKVHADRAASLRAQLDVVTGKAAALPDLSRPDLFDLGKYDPRWKKVKPGGSQDGANMTDFGRKAIFEAYRRGAKQVEVAALFQISPGAASYYHREFEKLAAAGPGGGTTQAAQGAAVPEGAPAAAA